MADQFDLQSSLDFLNLRPLLATTFFDILQNIMPTIQAKTCEIP